MKITFIAATTILTIFINSIFCFGIDDLLFIKTLDDSGYIAVLPFYQFWLYDANNVENVSGKVITHYVMWERQKDFDNKNDKGIVFVAILKPGFVTPTSVYIGPEWYVDKLKLTFNPGDILEIKGSQAKDIPTYVNVSKQLLGLGVKPGEIVAKLPLTEHPISLPIVAAELKKDNNLIKLRNDKGDPLWLQLKDDEKKEIDKERRAQGEKERSTLASAQKSFTVQGTISEIKKEMMTTFKGSFILITLSESPNDIFAIPFDEAEKSGLIKVKKEKGGWVSVPLGQIGADGFRKLTLDNSMLPKDYKWKVKLNCYPKGSFEEPLKEFMVIKSLRKIK